MTIDVEFVRFIGQAVVVGAGWWIVHGLTAKRDRDKARRDLVVKAADSLAAAVDQTLVAARTYHLEARNASAELRIKMSLQDLAMHVTSLSEVCNEEELLTPCRTDIAGLRRAITGQHFEDEHTAPLDEQEPLLQVIAEAAIRTKRSLLRLKHRQFPN